MFKAILLTTLITLPLGAFAQDEPLTPIGFCRIDGVDGGITDQTRTRFACIGSPQSAATSAAANAGQAALDCPALDVARAQARCEASGNEFMPAATLHIDVQRLDGTNNRERAAVSVKRVGSGGICTFSRVVNVRNDTSGQCLFWPRARSRVTTRNYCGYICR
ncbi:hypothetical protein BFP76_10840 [Amylibacter kogurei]|uniref:Uncharacterized protein n=1 Tax=Paramylibacter kogurei TaxID=1889778 RepID=A0A2G5KBD9_9RHOB|nr:hypothetical protein [Amylibacter kogurei]PIB26745.1 hypothetical protein BFP76_10840 [Amylibacter kogurei]